MFRIIDGERVYEDPKPQVDSLTLFQLTWSLVDNFGVNPYQVRKVLLKHLNDSGIHIGPRQLTS